VVAGVALYVLNPPVRSEAGDGAARPPVRSWLRPALLSVLIATTACTLVLGGTDVAIVAALKSVGQVSWTGLVLACWGLASLVGGFVYGAMRRGISAWTLAILIGVCTVPVGFFGNQWWVLCLALAPAGALCAPTLAATIDAVSRLAPEGIRGLVMGLHSSALTAGFAVGAPLSGAVVDATAPMWGFVAIGTAGALLATGAVIVRRLDPVQPLAPEQPLVAAAT
jgi:predicted MFS family arabinose efflux permease